MVTVIDKRAGIKENQDHKENNRDLGSENMEKDPISDEEESLSPEQYFSLLSNLMMQLPPEIMLDFVMQLSVERAWTALGLRVDPITNKTKVIPSDARLLIETGDFLFKNLGKNLPPDRAREIKNTLATLKLNFVDLTEKK